jgi:hypothetical protein
MRGRTRFSHLWFFVTVPLSIACGGQTPDAKDPSAAACGDGAGEIESLPRYLSLQLREEGPWVDGQRIGVAELSGLLREAAADPSIRGVAVVHEGGELSMQDVLAEVAKAGITHVVISGLLPESLGPQDDALAARSAIGVAPIEPQMDSAAPAQPSVAPVVSAEVAAVPAPAAAVPGSAPAPSPAGVGAEQPVPDDVSVRHYGLHIGGARDIEGVKDSYLKPIEKHFDEFRRCHALAKNRGLKASFGVDLLLSPSGGVPKVKDYRTLIKGKDFQLCALGVFAQVRWPLPEKPTIISYSVLFKPRGSE